MLAATRVAWARHAMLATGAGGLVGASAYYSSTDEPTRQVAVRAVRLGSTAVGMAMDYQTAAWSSKAAQLGESSSTAAQEAEHEIQRLQKALDDAQWKYTHVNDDLQHLSFADRVQAKQHEKQAMLQAAHDLAQAQQQHPTTKTARSLVHTHAAERLLRLCHENRGVYIKVGQHLANLDYLIPQEYIETLAALFDDNPHSSPEDVRAVIQEELGAAPDDLFDKFEYTPIASASLAQCHVAYEKGTGRKLAVKVQHRGLRETAMGDIRAVVRVVRWAERLFDGFTWGWICDEIEPLLPQELDFLNEGRNAERAAQHLQTTGLDCVVPKILWDKSSSRVLTMEFEQGFNATNVQAMEEAGLCKKDVAKLISSVFASQIFDSGWVHCDPHPANVLLRAKENGKPEMVLVDHGLYRELDPEFSRHYAALWKALLLADVSAVQESCRHLGVEDAYDLFAALVTSRPFDEVVERSKNGSLPQKKTSSAVDHMVMQGYAQKFIGDIIDLLGRIPRQMLLLLKTSDCLRHIDNSLGSPTNTLVVNGSYAAQAVYREESRHLERSSASWLTRMQVWLRYVSVLMRIRMHDLALQWSSPKLLGSTL